MNQTLKTYPPDIMITASNAGEPLNDPIIIAPLNGTIGVYTVDLNCFGINAFIHISIPPSKQIKEK